MRTCFVLRSFNELKGFIMKKLFLILLTFSMFGLSACYLGVHDDGYGRDRGHRDDNNRNNRHDDHRDDRRGHHDDRDRR